MTQINILDHDTIDKIAAGEVVEKPASVVKELIENSIDAGAGAVTVEIKGGGIDFIRVTDDGGGIAKTEIKKAFLRHATSKIKEVSDLMYVRSLGFRGEALSSIAAVSKVEMITKPEEELLGIHYVVEGAVEKEFDEIGAPNGTTIMVRNLFYNVPVRKKFLNQPQTEAGYIADLLEHIALANPNVSIKFIQNSQVKFHTSGNGDVKEIIYRIFGKDILNELTPIDVSDAGIHIYGFLGKPTINRSNRNFENYFINGRYVKSKVISQAIEEGYKEYLMQHKFPFVILQIDVDTALVDVNVHPTKMDVRITNEKDFYSVIVKAVSSTLSQIELIAPVKLVEEKPEVVLYDKKAPEPFEKKRLIEQTVMEETPEYTVKSEEMPILQQNLQKREESHIYGTKTPTKEEKNDNIHANIIKAKEHIFVEKPVQMDLFEERLLTKEAKSSYRILGQIFDTYWLVAFSDKLYIIDQHAAHEKVKYEAFMKRYEAGEIVSQSLNPPLILSLSGKEESVYQKNMDHFADMGFVVEPFGGNEYALRSVPMDLYGNQEKELFLAVLDELSEEYVKTDLTISQKIASMACKAAVKGNNRLSMAEMEALLDELLALDNPYHCPHGRPTIISMSKYEIEKKFKRIV